MAKALILDSASGWDKYKNPLWIGRGIVPVKIEDVVEWELTKVFPTLLHLLKELLYH